MTAAKPAPAPVSKAHSLALGFIAACLFIYICRIGAAVIMPLVISLFIWYLINAIARFLGLLSTKGGYKLPRIWRFVFAHVIIAAVGFLLYKMVSGNINDVLREAPKYGESFDRILAQVAKLLELDHTPTLHEAFKEIFGNYVDLGQFITVFAGMLTGIAGKTIIILFYVGFLLYEQRWFNRKMKLMIPDKEREQHVRHVLKVIDTKIQKYIGVKAFVSLLDSFLTFLILTYFKVDFAGFWGVMAFFLHFIPYAGSFVAVTTPCLIALIQHGDLTMLAFLLATLLTSHAFLGHILDPYLMGNNLNLSPIFIISNLAMWGMLWGVPGMFLAIPILAITTIALSQFEATRPVAVLFSKTGLDHHPKRKRTKPEV
jgi:predicted PurR-regulated permease PerM